ncbi:MAG: heterodisulfide reductase-related iron-sulfur binding cluster [Verrucomicrobiota bacterium]
MPSPSLLAKLDYSVLQQCMHCGMCLPTCPTYMETKRERNSPRGRISLMRAVADGDLTASRAFAEEMYYCLGCLACETACPAGVDYGHLFETARAEVERVGTSATPQRTFWRWLTLNHLFQKPRLLRAVGSLMRIYQQSGMMTLVRTSGLLRFLPPSLRDLEPQTPVIAPAFSDQLISPVEVPAASAGHRSVESDRSDKSTQPAATPPRYRVGLLTGCVQDLVFPDINRDTADVLLANNCEVVTPPVQPCCGSLHAHNGDLEAARSLARRQLDLFPVENLDALITNAGGCGSHLKKYHHLLADDPAYAARAALWDLKMKDIHEFLSEIGCRVPEAGCGETRATYHESCHLCHGQKVTRQPREILKLIPGLKLTELPESSWCCGSAGIYNITQPEQSAKLLQRKLQHLESTGAPVVATANPGCHLQLQNGLRAQDSPSCQTVTHPITLLARAYRAGQTGAGQ